LYKSASFFLAALSIPILRTLFICVLALTYGSISLNQALTLLMASEVLTLSILLVISFKALSKVVPRKTSREPEYPTNEMIMRVGLSNYAGYVLCQAWGVATLQLLVSLSASAQMSAAFGLFLSLADRARTYLPVALMERQLEPVWSADFHRIGRVERFGASAGAMLKTEFHVLAASIVFLSWCGDWLLSTLIQPTYGDSVSLLIIALFRVMIMSYQSVLWVGSNASGQSEIVWRANLRAFVILLVPILYSGLKLHPGITLVVAMLPAVVWIIYVMNSADRRLGRALLRPPSGTQVIWLLAMSISGLFLQGHFPVGYMVATPLVVYWLGVAIQVKLLNAPLMQRHEWFSFWSYVGPNRMNRVRFRV
jgi:hypothetical protein